MIGSVCACTRATSAAQHSAIVQRYYRAAGLRDLAYVLVSGPGGDVACRRFRAAAHKALVALGWRIVLDSSQELYDLFPESEDLSAHQRLAGIARVQTALDAST